MFEALPCFQSPFGPEKHGDDRFTAGQYSKDTLGDKWPALGVEDSETYAGKASKKKKISQPITKGGYPCGLGLRVTRC